MPALSMFYGIIVYMYNEKGNKHNKPHIHAVYQDNEVSVTLEGEVLQGSIPRKKMKLLDAWLVLHKEELEANWKLLNDGQQHFKIAPLQ
jgi:hypothetical protein